MVSTFNLPLAATRPLIVLMNEEGTKLILDQRTGQVSIGSAPQAILNKSRFMERCAER